MGIWNILIDVNHDLFKLFLQPKNERSKMLDLLKKRDWGEVDFFAKTWVGLIFKRNLQTTSNEPKSYD